MGNSAFVPLEVRSGEVYQKVWVFICLSRDVFYFSVQLNKVFYILIVGYFKKYWCSNYLVQFINPFLIFSSMAPLLYNIQTTWKIMISCWRNQYFLSFREVILRMMLKL